MIGGIFRIACGFACLCLACPGAAAAADCSLKIVNTVPLTVAANGRRVFVPVTINGTQEQFLLDTGGALSQISAPVAKSLNLPIGENHLKMLDLYGEAATDVARIESFGLGRLKARDISLPVMTATFEGRAFVGILAADLMGEYDVELDFAGAKMNYMSQDHCDGNVVYWPAAAVAVVPMEFRDAHLILPVMLDGKPVKAMIDTGAPNTLLYASAARQLFDITADSPGVERANPNNGAFGYVFKDLTFEGVKIGNPHIVVLPDRTGSKDPNNGYVTGTRVRHEDDHDPDAPVMLIGMNVLSKLHLYIAFGERKIYITPAGAPAPAQPSQATAASASVGSSPAAGDR
jgi:predicted aspartyl protease